MPDLHVLMWPEDWKHEPSTDPDAELLEVTCKVTHEPSNMPLVETVLELGSTVITGLWLPTDSNREYVMEFKGKSARVVWDHPDCYFELEVNGTEGTLSAWRGGQDGFHLVRRGMLTLQFCES